MLRTAILCVAIVPLIGCATNAGVEDELAGESDADGEVGKGDGEEAFTYFEVAPDPRGGTGFLVSRPNRAKTSCGSASLASCYAGSIDWSSVRLAAATTQGFETRLLQGEPILLRGRLATETAAGRDARANATLAGDVSAAIAPAQPMVDVGAPNGPDCLYAQLDVASVKPTLAALTISEASPGSYAFQGHLDNVTITGTSKYAVSCISGMSTVVTRIARVDVTGVLTVDAAGVATLGSETTAFTGLTVDDTGQPDAVRQMLDLRNTGAQRIVMQTAALVLGPIVAKSGELQLTVTEAWVPGHTTGADDEVENVFVLAKTRTDAIREQRLNSSRGANIDTIDFAASNASEASIAAARAALGGPGVIFAGQRFLDHDGQIGRTAERFWTRAE